MNTMLKTISQNEGFLVLLRAATIALATAMDGLAIGVETVLTALRELVALGGEVGSMLTFNKEKTAAWAQEFFNAGKEWGVTTDKIVQSWADIFKAQQQAQNGTALGHGKLGSDASDAKQELEIQKQDIADEMKLELEKLKDKRELLDESLNAEQITAQQKIATLKDYADQEYKIKLDALNAEEGLNDLSEKDWNKVQDEKLLISAQHNSEIDKLNIQSMANTKKEYDQIFGQINSAFSTMVSGILQGTQTWQQAFTKLLSNMLVKFAEFCEQKLSKWVESELLQTGASVAADGTRTASQIASAEAGEAAHIASATKSILIDSKSTFAGVYADLSPYLGPLAAIPAGAASAVVAAAASFDVGSYNVPSDMLANIHQGEMIIPKPFADSIRGGGGLGGGDTYHVTINAVDAMSVQNLLKANSQTIAQIVNVTARNSNSNLKAVARM